jgi:hypothetical protein
LVASVSTFDTPSSFAMTAASTGDVAATHREAIVRAHAR